MRLKVMLSKCMKVFVEYILQALVGYILVALILAGGGIYLLTKIGLSWVVQTANIDTPLWATISLTLLCCLYTYAIVRRSPHTPPIVGEELREEFGVYWNSHYKLRCLKCKWPLKCASKGNDPSLFWCSNCNTKFALKDPNGIPLTEANAIERLRNSLTTG